jgi:hypothetical protein
MACEDSLKNIDENAILTFLTETKNGEFGAISVSGSQLSRIEAQREEPTDPIYYYSFQ